LNILILILLRAPYQHAKIEFCINTIVTEAQITSIPIPPISRHNRTSPVVAPTEAQLKAEIDIWGTTNYADISAFNSVLKLPVAGARIRRTGRLGNVGYAHWYKSP
jgi:hypothetical protein